MKTAYKILCGVLALIIAATSCNDNTRRADLDRLDHRLAADSLDAGSRRAAELLFRLSGYGELTDSSLAAYNSMPSIAYHRAAVDSAFADITPEREALGAVYSKLSKLLPDVRIPDTYTIISPFNQSVISADSVLFIGLNHYLGPDYSAYAYFPEYIRQRKSRDRLPIDVAEALVRINRPFATDDTSPALLSRLIYEGAVTMAVTEATDIDMAKALGYSAADMQQLREHEGALWRALLERNLVYTTDPAVIRQILSPVPATSGFGAGLPGNIGRYIGSQMVSCYMKHNRSASLDSILTSSPNPTTFLRDSGY